MEDTNTNNVVILDLDSDKDTSVLEAEIVGLETMLEKQKELLKGQPETLINQILNSISTQIKNKKAILTARDELEAMERHLGAINNQYQKALALNCFKNKLFKVINGEFVEFVFVVPENNVPVGEPKKKGRKGMVFAYELTMEIMSAAISENLTDKEVNEIYKFNVGYLFRSYILNHKDTDKRIENKKLAEIESRKMFPKPRTLAEIRESVDDGTYSNGLPITSIPATHSTPAYDAKPKDKAKTDLTPVDDSSN